MCIGLLTIIINILIVISLIEKTLKFYGEMNILFTFEQFYSKPYSSN